MYYVIFTGSGKESKTEEYIRRMIPDCFYDVCFHPSRKRNMKIGGTWHTCCDNLIPGYVFLKTGCIEDFYKEIRKNSAHLKILGRTFEDESLSFYQLTKEEEEWLGKLTGSQDAINPIAEISEVGFDENDRIVILSGPLKDLEGNIKKMNLHKRVAEVELDFMGRKTVLYLGLELLKTK